MTRRFEIDPSDPVQVAAFALGAAVMGGLLCMALAIREAEEARKREKYWAGVRDCRARLVAR